MPNNKVNFIIFLQAVIIITLIWVLVFFSKDEFESYQFEQEDEVESINHVKTENGVNKIKLSLAVQKNSGIETGNLQSSKHLGEIKTFGQVLPIDVLLDAKTRFLTLNAELALAKSASSQNLMQYERLKALNEDDKNVSDRAVQEALTMVNADNAKILAAETQLKNLQSSMQLQWGDMLAKLALSQTNEPHLTQLLTRKNVLVQITMPVQSASPSKNSTIQVLPLSGNIAPITAIFVSPAPQSDANSFGKTYFYSAPAEFLRTGMRVNIVSDTSKTQDAQGVAIPHSAVVWYGGLAWVYVKLDDEDFVRKAITTDVEIEQGWFNQTIPAGTEVVTRGAQLLLSEEFKFLIKNENDD